MGASKALRGPIPPKLSPSPGPSTLLRAEQGAWTTMTWFGILVSMSGMLNKLGVVRLVSSGRVDWSMNASRHRHLYTGTESLLILFTQYTPNGGWNCLASASLRIHEKGMKSVDCFLGTCSCAPGLH